MEMKSTDSAKAAFPANPGENDPDFPAEIARMYGAQVSGWTLEAIALTPADLALGNRPVVCCLGLKGRGPNV